MTSSTKEPSQRGVRHRSALERQKYVDSMPFNRSLDFFAPTPYDPITKGFVPMNS